MHLKGEAGLQRAIKILKRGGIGAIPTETVYGLAGSAYDEAAISAIYTIKKRPFTSPLIVHTDAFERILDFVGGIPPKAKALAKAFWPGGLTLLLPKKSIIPPLATANLPTVGVRIPAHPLTRKLLQNLPFPLVAPSANPFGGISPTTAEHVGEQMGDCLDFILDGGPCSLGVESTIIAFPGGISTLHRHGAIPMEAIEKIIGPLEIHTKKSPNRRESLASGMTEHHYAPQTPLYLGALPAHLKEKKKAVGFLNFKKMRPDFLPNQQWILSSSGDLQEAAHLLFSTLHAMDRVGFAGIVAEKVPDIGIGKAINDRLLRASRKKKL